MNIEQLPTPTHTIVVFISIKKSNFCCAQILVAEMDPFSAPRGDLIALGKSIHWVRGVSMSPLCVMAIGTVLMALMKWTVELVSPLF